MKKIGNFFVLLLSVSMLAGCSTNSGGGNNKDNHEHIYGSCEPYNDGENHALYCEICGDRKLEKHTFEEAKTVNNVSISEGGSVTDDVTIIQRCSKCGYERQEKTSGRLGDTAKQSIIDGFIQHNLTDHHLSYQLGNQPSTEYDYVLVDSVWRKVKNGSVENYLTFGWMHLLEMLNGERKCEAFETKDKYALRSEPYTITQPDGYSYVEADTTIVLDKQFNILNFNHLHYGYSNFILDSKNYDSYKRKVNTIVNTNASGFRNILDRAALLPDNYTGIEATVDNFSSTNNRYEGTKRAIEIYQKVAVVRDSGTSVDSSEFYLIKDGDGWKKAKEPFTGFDTGSLEDEIKKIAFLEEFTGLLKDESVQFVFSEHYAAAYFAYAFVGDVFYHVDLYEGNDGVSLIAIMGKGGKYDTSKGIPSSFRLEFDRINTEVSGEDYLPDEIFDIVHTHTYSEEWTPNYDSGHFHKCTCGHDNGPTEPHVWLTGADRDEYGWKVTEEATYTQSGEKERVCSVCGYKQEEIIPQLYCEHENVTQKHDDTYHWDECDTCGEVFNKETHTLGGWVYDYANGRKYKVCSSCNSQVQVTKVPTASGNVPEAFTDADHGTTVSNFFNNVEVVRETIAQTITYPRNPSDPYSTTPVTYGVSTTTTLDRSYAGGFYMHTQNTFDDDASKTYFHGSANESFRNSELLIVYVTSESKYNYSKKDSVSGSVTGNQASATTVNSIINPLYNAFKQRNGEIEYFLETQNSAFTSSYAQNLDNIKYVYAPVEGGYTCTITGTVNTKIQGYDAQLAFEGAGITISYNEAGVLTGYEGTLKVYLGSGGMYYLNSTTTVHATYEYTTSSAISHKLEL